MQSDAVGVIGLLAEALSFAPIMEAVVVASVARSLEALLPSVALMAAGVAAQP